MRTDFKKFPKTRFFSRFRSTKGSGTHQIEEKEDVVEGDRDPKNRGEGDPENRFWKRN